MRYFLYTMIIFSRFFREFNLFSIENSKFYFKSWTLQRMSRMTKHVSKAGKVHQGDRVNPTCEIFLEYTS